MDFSHITRGRQKSVLSIFLIAALIPQPLNAESIQTCEFVARGWLVLTNEDRAGSVMVRTNEFLVYAKNDESLIRVTGSNGVDLESPGPQDDYAEYGIFEGTNSYVLHAFAQGDGTNKSVNSADLKMARSVVPGIESGPIASVWLAFIGGRFYGNAGKGLLEPVCPPGPGFRDRGLKLQATWETKSKGDCGVFLESYADFSDGYRYVQVQGQMSRKELKIKSGTLKTNCVFRTLGWTNYDGRAIPNEALLQCSFFSMNPLDEKEYRGACWIRLKEVRWQLPTNAFKLALSGPTFVADRRFVTDENVPAVYTYMITNELRSAKDAVEDPRLHALLKYTKTTQARKQTTVPYIILFLIFLSPLLYLGLQFLKSKKQQTNKHAS